MRHFRFPHVHWDFSWQAEDHFGYYACRCGARRVRRLTLRSAATVKPGWPEPVDRHRRPVMDSGWHKMPPMAGLPSRFRVA